MNPNRTFSVKDYALDRLRTYWRLARYYNNFVRPNGKLLEKTAALRSVHKGTSAFVFGCGPSINMLDKQKIKKYQKEQQFRIYAVNSYITAGTSLEVIPDYYILSDPANLGQPKDEEHRRTTEIIWQRLTDNHIPVFVPADLYQNVEYQNKHIFCDHENLYRRNVTDILHPRGFVSLTVLKAMQIALFMGHDKIYISGVDHDHSRSVRVNKDNKILYDETHFYDGQNKMTTVEWNHGSMMKLFYAEYLGFESYNRFAGHPIINLNPESFVDCFSKEHHLDVYKK